MKDILEIRWHGRGGQGVKTAALLFAEAALSTGKYVQAFPEYGPERMGAPVVSFTRISNTPIRIHSAVTEPDIVVVLDITLMTTGNIVDDVSKNSIILVNTNLTPTELKEKMNIKQEVHTVDATAISRECLGREMPNTPMIGALVKFVPLLNIEYVVEDIRHKMEKKFRDKSEVIEGNIKSIIKAYNEVK